MRTRARGSARPPMHVRRLSTEYPPTVAGNLFPIGRVLFGVEPVGRFLSDQRRERLDYKVPRSLSGDAALVTLEHPLRLAGERRAVDQSSDHTVILLQTARGSEVTI